MSSYNVKYHSICSPITIFYFVGEKRTIFRLRFLFLVSIIVRGNYGKENILTAPSIKQFERGILLITICKTVINKMVILKMFPSLILLG